MVNQGKTINTSAWNSKKLEGTGTEKGKKRQFTGKSWSFDFNAGVRNLENIYQNDGGRTWNAALALGQEGNWKSTAQIWTWTVKEPIKLTQIRSRGSTC